jgi:hypothetical protein
MRGVSQTGKPKVGANDRSPLPEFVFYANKFFFKLEYVSFRC